MEEQALNETLEAMRKGQCIVILDSKSKKAETDLFFPIVFFFPLFVKIVRIETRGELYIYVVHEIISTFGFLFIGNISTTHPQLFFFHF
jgi:3,4-dihydroxy-2-butanone 4-phosphate synthase